MLVRLRKTVSRGRSLPTRIRLRTPWRFRARVTVFFFCARMSVRMTAVWISLRAEGLAGLTTDHFEVVLDALALVGLRRLQLADARRELADLLLVTAPDDHGRRVRQLDVEALGHVDHDLVREAEAERQLATRSLRLVADADDLELPLVALRHTDDHVVEDRARRAVVRARLAVTAGAPVLDGDAPVVDDDSDLRAMLE